jgi:hypothetical protein
MASYRNGSTTVVDTRQTVADPGYVDLAKKYALKDYAVLSRELVLNAIANAACLTERVYWALILTSACGRYVREGCFLRDEDTGRLVTDEKKQVFPLRVKHLMTILKLDPADRGNVHRSIKKLVTQGRLEVHGDDKVWYPLLDPAKLAETPKVERKWCNRNSTLPYTFLSSFLRKALADEPVIPDAISDTAKADLKKLEKRYKSALVLLRQNYADVAKKLVFGDRIIISKDTEDTEEGERGGRNATSSVETPEQPRSSPPPSPAVISEPRPEPVTAVVVSEAPERELLWDQWRAIMDGCGKPVSVHMSAACRAEFFKYPVEVQRRILIDTGLRAAEHWDKPRFTPKPLDYLQKREWDINPVKPRSLPSGKTPSLTQQRNDALRRLMDRSIAEDRKESIR